MGKDRIRDVDVAVAQVVVQDAHDGLLAQQGGVQLDKGVQPLFLQQVPSDGLDLVGGTAVHGGKGHAVGELCRDLDVGVLGELSAQDSLDPGQFLRGVLHLAHEALHPLGLDALQVVTDAHVENGAERDLVLEP